MPALAIPAFWYAVSAGAGAAAGIYGANKSSDAADNAANLQSKSAADALDFTRQKEAQDQANFISTQKANYAQYVAQQARLAPYQAMGAAASARLATGLGLKPQAMPALPPPPDYTMFSGAGTSPKPLATKQTYAPTPTAPANGQAIGDGTMVQMRAPNGQVSMVPLNLKDHYTQLGAQVVN